MTNQARPVSPGDPDFDALFLLADTPLLEVDEIGRVWRANAAACRLLEVGPREASTHTLHELLGVDDDAFALADAPVEVLAVLASAEVRIDVQTAPRRLRGPTGQLTVVQLRRHRRAPDHVDVDRRASAERWSLLDDVSHNLGTPLAIISGYAQMLSERAEDVPAASMTRATEAIVRQAERAVDQLQALQARARVSTGGAGAIQSAMLLGWLRRMLADPLVAHGVVLTAELGPSVIHVDAATVRQVTLNIGHALLRGEPRPTTLHLAIRQVDGGTELRLSSDGGIPDGSDSDRHSTELVEAAEGRYARPTDDSGTYTVWLPSTSDESLDASPTISVAMIEDDPDTAALIRASLSNSAAMFELVAEARTLADGLVAVERTKPRILLLDQWLPDGVGTERLDDLHRAAPGMIVVVLSNLLPTAEQAGEAVWLQKGRVLADLGRQLIEVLATRPQR